MIERKPKPVTIARVEAALDKLAVAMSLRKDRGRACLPIYESLIGNLDRMKHEGALLADAKARAERVNARGGLKVKRVKK